MSLRPSLETNRTPYSDHRHSSVEKHENKDNAGIYIAAGVVATVAGLGAWSYYKFNQAQKKKKRDTLNKSNRRSIANTQSQQAVTSSQTQQPSTQSTTTGNDNLTSSATSSISNSTSSIGSSGVVVDNTSSNALPTEDELRELLGQSLDAMNNSGVVDGNEHTLDVLRRVSDSGSGKIGGYSNQTRLVAAQCM